MLLEGGRLFQWQPISSDFCNMERTVEACLLIVGRSAVLCKHEGCRWELQFSLWLNMKLSVADHSAYLWSLTTLANLEDDVHCCPAV